MVVQGRSRCSKRRVGCAAEGMVFRPGCAMNLVGPWLCHGRVHSWVRNANVDHQELVVLRSGHCLRGGGVHKLELVGEERV